MKKEHIVLLIILAAFIGIGFYLYKKNKENEDDAYIQGNTHSDGVETESEVEPNTGGKGIPFI